MTQQRLHLHNTFAQKMNEKPTMDVERGKNSRKEIILLLLFTALFIAINAIRIWNDSISGDEGFSIMLVKDSVRGMIQATAGDVHPPFYYLIFKVFSLIIGISAMAGRVVTFTAIMITMILANTYIRRQFGVYAAAFFIILLTFNVTGIEMIVEARMYTWAMLFVTLTAVFGYELMRKQSLWKWLGFLVFGLAAGYTHYYALIMVAFIYLVTFAVLIIRDRKNLLPCFLCGIGAVICYFPWLLILVKQFGTVSDNYWIHSIEVKEWIRYIFGHDRFGKLLRIILAITGFLYLITKEGLTITHGISLKKADRNKNRQFLRFDWDHVPTEQKNERLFVLMCGITVVGTLAVATVVSYLVRPLYVERYLYSAYGLIALAFGISFANVSRKKLYSWVLIAAIIIVGQNSFREIYRTEQVYMTEDSKTFFANNLEPGDVFVTDNSQLSWTVLDYYFPDRKNYALGEFDFFTKEYHTVWYLSEKPELDERIITYEAQGLQVTHVCDSGIGRYPYYLYKIVKNDFVEK